MDTYETLAGFFAHHPDPLAKKDDILPTPPSWELYIFITLEVILLLIILRLIWLISVYLHRFGK